MFSANRAMPGVTHITDAMGVSFTLIEGEKSAILFDTGYGTEDAGAYVKTWEPAGSGRLTCAKRTWRSSGSGPEICSGRRSYGRQRIRAYRFRLIL